MQASKIDLLQIFQDNFMMSEAYNRLRTNIELCGDDVKVIALTSCIDGEGKTSVSMELAKSLSQIDKKVLFIDADMRRSSALSRYTSKKNGEPVMGLSDLLLGHASISDVLLETQYDGFYIIFSGDFPPEPTELLENARFRSLINSAKEIFDYVIVDCPPLGIVADAAVVARYCDSAVMVIGSDMVNCRFVQDVHRQLAKSGCRILGAVLNCATVSNYGSSRYYKKYSKKIGSRKDK